MKVRRWCKNEKLLFPQANSTTKTLNQRYADMQMCHWNPQSAHGVKLANENTGRKTFKAKVLGVLRVASVTVISSYVKVMVFFVGNSSMRFGRPCLLHFVRFFWRSWFLAMLHFPWYLSIFGLPRLPKLSRLWLPESVKTKDTRSQNFFLGRFVVVGTTL